HIDRLATEGMRFERCFQAAPMCSPTRHNIYTGLYPVRSGAYPNHTFANPGTKSIAHYLRPLGYRVALSGKTHIGPREIFPFEYSGKGNNPDMEQVNRLFAECQESKTPFCLFACSNEPHSPWNKGDASRYPPDQVKLPPYIADTPVVREAFSRYLAEITYYDGQVGEILSLLEKHGLAQDTVVMVTSEQGNSFPFAKWTCYGNGLQTAMIVRWPGKVRAATTSRAMIEYVDVTPTMVDLAGGEGARELEGRSFAPVLRGEADHHKDHVFGIMTTRGIINGSDAFGIRTVRDDRYRLIWNLHSNVKFTNACTEAAYFTSMVEAAAQGDKQAKELVDRYHYRAEWELFDCEQDPLEMTNLADRPELARVKHRLQRELEAWMKSQGDQGVETELNALLHQTRYKNMTPEEALSVWQKQGDNAKKQGKGQGKKGKAKRKQGRAKQPESPAKENS
ncbi:MAG: sulfatase, partial [Planctomycetales bacterium]|nr:sulfatase [Planctomycetales bacterium]